jgi:hypothetical protein
MTARPLTALLLATILLGIAASSRAQIVDAIEFYHSGLDHYFVTAGTEEIAALDNGIQKGWLRTGYSFGVYAPGADVSGSSPVCRFYGNPAYGLDSHFYSASPAECAEVQQKWPEKWQLESYEVFRVVLPDSSTGYCRSGTEPLYRLFNQRSDVNHRYLTNYGAMEATQSRGYVLEGYGTPPVAMCVPYPPIQTAVPVCEIEAYDSEPVASTVARLTTTCTNHPKSFVWTNCTSNSGVCYATRAGPGPVTYTVVATNEAGNSSPATRTLNWDARPPRCSIAIRTAPVVGIPQTLYQSCDGNPTAFFWTNCESKGETCIANAAAPGPQTYTLYASNVWGTGLPSSQTLLWMLAVPACSVTKSFVSASVATLKAICSGSPTSYQWTNCASTTDTCTATSTVSGPITYTVRGINGYGTGDPASVTVEWPGPKPVCTISASTLSPITGGELILTANCSGYPYNYLWYGCVGGGTDNTCRDIANSAQTRTYTVIATNLTGASEPVSLAVTWQAGLVAPVCDLFGPSSEFIGTPVRLDASCTGNPTSYDWIGCVSNTAMCTTTNALAGDVSYSVRATNAAGTSKAATHTVSWYSFVPACTLSVNDPKPQVGTVVGLKAYCTNSPTSYAWTNCSSTTDTCTIAYSVPGVVTFSVSATNGYGTSPIATIQVDWQP